MAGPVTLSTREPRGRHALAGQGEHGDVVEGEGVAETPVVGLGPPLVVEGALLLVGAGHEVVGPPPPGVGPPAEGVTPQVGRARHDAVAAGHVEVQREGRPVVHVVAEEGVDLLEAGDVAGPVPVRDVGQGVVRGAGRLDTGVDLP